MIFSITEFPSLSHSDRITFFYIWMNNWEMMLLYLLKSRNCEKRQFNRRKKSLWCKNPSYFKPHGKRESEFFHGIKKVSRALRKGKNPCTTDSCIVQNLWKLRECLTPKCKVRSIRRIFIFHKTFALKSNWHHDKAEILSFLARLIMHWYLAQDAFHRTFTLCSKIQYWIPDVKMLQKFFLYG